jgi:hypothetical protein
MRFERSSAIIQTDPVWTFHQVRVLDATTGGHTGPDQR